MKTDHQNTNLPDTCPACQAEDPEWQLAAKETEQVFRGETFTVPSEVYTCPKCGFEFIADEAAEQMVRATWSAYREKHGLLQPDEIVARRKSLGMSQASFADFLGVGKASIQRWKKGLVQDKSSDNLIRSKTEKGKSPTKILVQVRKAKSIHFNIEDLHRIAALPWTSPARNQMFVYGATHKKEKQSFDPFRMTFSPASLRTAGAFSTDELPIVQEPSHLIVEDPSPYSHESKTAKNDSPLACSA